MELLFGRHEFVADLNCREFVLADASVQNLLQTGDRIEMPGAVAVNERYRERPVLGPEVQGHRSIRIVTETMHLLIFLLEHFAVVLILGCIA